MILRLRMSRNWNDELVCAGAMILTQINLSKGDTFGLNLYILGIFIAECLTLFFLKSQIENNIQESIFRPKCSAGIIFVLAVPIAILNNNTSQAGLNGTVQAFTQSMAVSIVLIAKFMSKAKFRNVFVVFLLVIGVILPCAVCSAVEAIATITCSLLVWKAVDIVPASLPKSFTLGELSIILQITAVWVCRVANGLIHGTKLINHGADADEMKTKLFVCTLLASVVTSSMLVFLSRSYKSLVQTVTIFLCHALASLLFLQWWIGEHVILWLFSYIYSSCSRIMLAVIMMLLIALTILWTVIEGVQSNMETSREQFAYDMSQNNINKDDSLRCVLDIKQNIKITQRSNSFEMRKVFHLFILLVYVPGLLLDPGFLLLASTCALGVFIIVEFVRALQVPVLGPALESVLRPFVDERDQGSVFLTHIYLLAGLSLPLWLSNRVFLETPAPLEMYSGVLALGIGDTVACLVGGAVGRVMWPGTKKTLEGTLASVVAQFAFIILLSSTGQMQVTHYLTPSVGIILTAIVEAVTDQIDNLILPLLLYPFLCA